MTLVDCGQMDCRLGQTWFPDLLNLRLCPVYLESCIEMQLRPVVPAVLLPMFAAFPQVKQHYRYRYCYRIRRQQSCDKSFVFHAVTEGARTCQRALSTRSCPCVFCRSALSARYCRRAFVGALLSCALMSGHPRFAR